MALFSKIAGLWRNLLQRERTDRDLDAEVRAHLELLTDENVKGGMSLENARRAARVELGGVEQVKEEVRGGRVGVRLELLWQDVRFGARQLRRNPGFTLIAVLTLALGIGANTAIFSVVNALLLRPYPFPQLERLVLVRPTGTDRSAEDFRVPPADFADLQRDSPNFEKISAFRRAGFQLTAAGLPESVDAVEVTPDFFNVVGVQPAIGRGFVPDEEKENGNRSAILSYGYWQSRFSGDARLVGSAIQLDGANYTVVGIMPPRYSYPLAVQIWLPLALTPAEKSQRTEPSLRIVARLRAGVSLATANAAIQAFSAQLADRYPQTNAGRGMSLLRLREEQYQFTAPLFLMLQLAAGFLLLLACANLINLLFARVLGRQKEIALRASLGASSGRLAQLFFFESLLVSMLAAGIAAAAAAWTVGLIRTGLPPSYTKYIAGWEDIRVDQNVLLFTALLAALAGIAFGLATAAKSSRIQLNDTLKASAGSVLGGRARLRGALVSVQVVLAMVMLTGAGLMIQGFVRLVGLYQGLDPVGVLRLRISLPKERYAEDRTIAAFFEQAAQRCAALPGVQSVALADNTPASNVDNDRAPFQIEGQPARALAEMPVTDLMLVNADYFRTLRIPILAGRSIQEQDRSESPRILVISQSMARRFWPERNPVGERVRLGPPGADSTWWTVVGVVGDVKQNWWDPQPRPTVYRSFLQAPARGMILLARSSGVASTLTDELRRQINGLDSQIAPAEANTLEREIADALGPIRVIGVLMMLFGAAALTLSAAGVYGVLAQMVAQRSREFGIRLALGAEPREPLRLVLRQAMVLAGAGLAFALPLAYMLSRAMESFLFGVVSLRWTVLAGFAVLLMAVALAAGFGPARRAARVDPMIALREQ